MTLPDLLAPIKKRPRAMVYELEMLAWIDKREADISRLIRALECACEALEYYAAGYTAYERIGDTAKPPGEQARQARAQVLEMLND